MSLESEKFRRKIIVVTGASRGIGKGVALEFARQGAEGIALISSGKNPAKAEEVAHLVEGMGARALVILKDLADPSVAEDIISTAKKELGQVNILVNNAGINRDNNITRMGLDDWDAVMDVNLRAAFLLSKYAFGAFPKIEGGKLLDGNIVNISSLAGIYGNSGQENYAASKGGLIALTQSLARNFGRRGVRVNAVAPGYIDTDMTQSILPQYNDLILEAAVSLTPMARLGTVEDVANAVTFLASDRASFITGVVLPVDGGMGGSLHAGPTVFGLLKELSNKFKTT